MAPCASSLRRPRTSSRMLTATSSRAPDPQLACGGIPSTRHPSESHRLLVLPGRVLQTVSVGRVVELADAATAMEDVLITRTSRVGETPLRTGLRRVGRERLGVYRGMFVKRLSQWPLRAAFRSLSRFIRRDSDLVVFGSVRNRFADNSAYLFLNMAQDEQLRCVWISGSQAVVKKLRQEGFDARHRWSIEGL